jgi:Flp pilus assembly protein TadG
MLKMLLEHRRERGAVAVIVALMVVVLMASAALGVDIGKLVYERQQLQNALDAAATAGAMHLPDDPAAAIVDAQKFAADNMIGANLGSITPSIALRCVTSYNATTHSPDWATVVAVCGITSHTFDVLDCNEQVCSVACTVAFHCNTIVVKHNLTVAYSFGPAIGIPTGQTGTISAAACRGICGTVTPNPLDIVVMADRTPSMQDNFSSGGWTTPSGSFSSMKAGIEDMLGSMNQDQQYVAFGTLAISVPTTGDKAAPPNGGDAFSDATYRSCDKFGKNCTWTKGGKKWHFNGSWVPVGFTNKYTKTDGAGVTTVDSTTTLGKAVHNLTYSTPEVDYPDADNGQSTSSNEGTHLAAALKGAARYLLNVDPSADAGLPVRPKEFGTPKKVIIFETDGSPSEIFTSDSTATTLTNSLDIGVDGNNNKQSCDNFSAIASEAKGAGITIITIGIGAVNKATCGSSNVRDVMAAAASPRKSGAASDAYDCTQSGKATAENTDGDNYFCAATSSDLKSVFIAAMGSLTKSSKLMALPNVT